jgi:hypothetical protein
MPGRTLSNKQVMESIRLIGFTHESRHRGNDGAILRSWAGGPPQGTSMGKVLKIEAEQDGNTLAVEIDYDRQIWSGLSWGGRNQAQRHFERTCHHDSLLISREERGDPRWTALQRSVLKSPSFSWRAKR